MIINTGGTWKSGDENAYFLANGHAVHFLEMMHSRGGNWQRALTDLYARAAADPKGLLELMNKTGGEWDRELVNQYFLATDHLKTMHIVDGVQGPGGLIYPYLLVAINEIETRMELVMEITHAMGAHWFIDSGIFNLTNEHMRAHGITMDEALALPCLPGVSILACQCEGLRRTG